MIAEFVNKNFIMELKLKPKMAEFFLQINSQNFNKF